MKGILLYGGADAVIEKRAQNARIKLGKIDFPPQELPCEKNLIVQAGTRVPWDLLPAAWNFLEHWDAAVPLWRYGVLAADVGTPEERKATQAMVRDLRVLLHSYELLFVRRSAGGIKLVEQWRQECSGGCDKRLAFLRAFYIVKPMLCVLPTTWLAQIKEAEKAAAVRGHVINKHVSDNMVRLEISPGRFVKVRAGNEAAALEQFKRQNKRR
jgi:hypothetical protein